MLKTGLYVQNASKNNAGFAKLSLFTLVSPAKAGRKNKYQGNFFNYYF